MNNTPTPRYLDNLPLNEALRFADENSTTGGLVTQAALKTLAAGCRELTEAREELKAVTEQRDKLAEALENNWELLIALHHYFDADYPIDVTLIHHAAKLTREALQSLNQDHTVDANDMIAAVKGGIDES